MNEDSLVDCVVFFFYSAVESGHPVAFGVTQPSPSKTRSCSDLPRSHVSIRGTFRGLVPKIVAPSFTAFVVILHYVLPQLTLTLSFATSIMRVMNMIDCMRKLHVQPVYDGDEGMNACLSLQAQV